MVHDTWNKLMHECETIITHHFGDLLFTIVFVVLCIIVNIGIMEGTKLTLSSKKAALLLKCQTQCDHYTRSHLLSSTTGIQIFSIVQFSMVDLAIKRWTHWRKLIFHWITSKSSKIPLGIKSYTHFYQIHFLIVVWLTVANNNNTNESS